MSEKMTRQEIEARVREYLVQEQGVDPDKIKLESSFITDLAFDSLAGIELLTDLEDKFNLSIPDDAADKIQTVGQAVEYIYSICGRSEDGK